MRRLILPATATFVALAACTIPTDVPVTDVRWIVPAQTTRIAVASFLPAGASVTADTSAFLVAVPPASVTRFLSQDCPLCVAANGLTVPKPAFQATSSVSNALPADIASATLASGASLQLVLQNGNNFDPLRPNPTAFGGATGYAIITVTNGATLLGRDSVNGNTSALPPGGSLTRTIPLSGTISSNSPITVTMTVDSPTGEPITINTSRAITITATPQNIRVPSASVVVSNKSLSSTSSQDFTDIDSTIVNHVQSGNLLLTIANPFNAAGNLIITLTPDVGAAVGKSAGLTAGNSTVSIPFTALELKRLLGHTVTVTYTGTVNSTGPISVSPKQAVVVQARLDLSLELGTPKP